MVEHKWALFRATVTLSRKNVQLRFTQTSVDTNPLLILQWHTLSFESIVTFYNNSLMSKIFLGPKYGKALFTVQSVIVAMSCHGAKPIRR